MLVARIALVDMNEYTLLYANRHVSKAGKTGRIKVPY